MLYCAPVSAIEIIHYTPEHPQGLPGVVCSLQLNMWYIVESMIQTFDNEHVNSHLRDPSMFIVDIQLKDLVIWYRFLNVKELQLLCRAHCVPFLRLTKDGLRARLTDVHLCNTNCRPMLVSFKCLRTPRPLSEILLQFASRQTIQAVHVVDGGSRHRSAGPSHPVGNGRLSDSQLDSSVPDPLNTAHLKPLDRELKEKILHEWQQSINTQRLSQVACAVCGRRFCQSDTSLYHAEELDLTLLRNDSLPVDSRPTTYDFHLYNRAILYAKGLMSPGSLGYICACKTCSTALKANRMPKFALANWLYYGYEALPTHVQHSFNLSTVFERTLISRARCNNITCRFNQSTLEGAGHVQNDQLSRARRGMRGNVVVLPLDVMRMSNVLPPGPETIEDTLCALIVSATSRPLTADFIRSLSPILVRKSRITTLLHFLMSKNPFYSEASSVTFSSQNLDQLVMNGEDEGVPPSVRVETVILNDAISVATSDYTSRNRPVHILCYNLTFPHSYLSRPLSIYQHVT